MAQFDNVSVKKKANIYFDGKCVSHTILLPNGKEMMTDSQNDISITKEESSGFAYFTLIVSKKFFESKA